MWLFGVARRAAANARRASARSGALVERLTEQLESLSPEEPDDRILEVRDALASLPDNQSELVMLVHWDGFTVIEAAAILRIRESTARGRYQRARLRLREALATRHVSSGHIPSLAP